MCKHCINSNYLIDNDDDGYHCNCLCRIKDVEFEEEPIRYNSSRDFSTNLKCSKCNHYVWIRYGQKVKVVMANE